MKKNVVEKPLKSELLLHDLNTDAVHVLNPTARAVYELLHAGRNLFEIETAIRQRFRISKEADISQDLHRCIADLKQKGLVDDAG